MPARRFVISSDIYPFKVAFWVGPWSKRGIPSWVKSIKLWDGEGAPPEEPGSQGACFNYGSGSLIWMPRPPRAPNDYSTLTHEIVHAVAHAGEVLGFKLTPESDEFYAYLSGFLMAESLKRLRR